MSSIIDGEPIGLAIDRENALTLLRHSRFFDQRFYWQTASLPEGVDPVVHYLDEGWRKGLRPNPTFDGDFLRPFYEATGFPGPPLLTFAELSMIGAPLPANREEAAPLAKRIAGSPLFDPAFYAVRLPAGMDAALHYAVIGERLGWRPSAGFDPGYYAEINSDTFDAGQSPLLHYETLGRAEKRRFFPAIDRLSFPPTPSDGRPTVLMVLHEATRTGAPILGWNVIRRLAERYNVVTFLIHGGELVEELAKISTVVGPLGRENAFAADARRVAERLVATYKPIYAIANSIETHLMVPPLSTLGVPVIALVHEFAGYTRPISKVRNIADWAAHVVYPADLVLQSAQEAVPILKHRANVHRLAQGPSDLPPASSDEATSGPRDEETYAALRPAGMEDSFVVVGLGFIHLRKGVDLFVSTVAEVRRQRPELDIRFVWVGDGFDPVRDLGFSVYLAEQIARSDLGDRFAIADAVIDLEPVYASADLFFMCSRLDPQPNVGIDALMRGLPTVSFDKASGTAEVLAADPATRRLVVPYVDVAAAAREIIALAEDRAALQFLQGEVRRVGMAAFDMDAYVRALDDMGTRSAARAASQDYETLVRSGIIEAEMAMPPYAIPHGVFDLERFVLLQWELLNGMDGDRTVSAGLRRPTSGFHPQSYASHHTAECLQGGADPLAHWVRGGCRSGPWSHPVIRPGTVDDGRSDGSPALNAALHCHFHYPELAEDLLLRLGANRLACDLFLSTDTREKAVRLERAFRTWRGNVRVDIQPNRGRDIGPFLTGLAEEISGGRYEVFGHVHAKRSLSVDAAMGESWRGFLWENLVGGEFAMADLAVRAFSRDPSLGLLFAEDPHLVGWNENRAMAEMLARRMNMIEKLPDYFDFPLGTMFWARPAALKPLLDLKLSWDDYPPEPLPYDGTILHAIERLMPFIARHAGYSMASLRVPGTSW